MFCMHTFLKGGDGYEYEYKCEYREPGSRKTGDENISKKFREYARLWANRGKTTKKN